MADSIHEHSIEAKARGIAWHAAAMADHAERCVQKGWERRDLDQIQQADRDAQFHFGMAQGFARLLNEGWHA